MSRIVDQADASPHSLQNKMEFIAPPPPQIGEIVFADTCQYEGRTRLSSLHKIAAIAVGAACSTIILLFWDSVSQTERSALLVVASVIAGGLVTSLVLLALLMEVRRRRRCSYVGTEGVAQYQGRYNVNRPPDESVFMFSDASYLRSAQTRHYTNSFYTGTNFAFTWYDTLDEPVFTIGGVYGSETGLPKWPSRYYFGQAAETAWSDYAIDHLQETLDEAGYVDFPVGETLLIRIRPGEIEFIKGKGSYRMAAGEIKRLSLDGGRFTFRHKDASFFGSAGKFHFLYGDVANAKLFLHCLSALVGCSFSDKK
jgi:hypothetical protein